MRTKSSTKSDNIAGGNEYENVWKTDITYQLNDKGYIISAEAKESEIYHDYETEWAVKWSVSYKDDYPDKTTFRDEEKDGTVYDERSYNFTWTDNNLSQVEYESTYWDSEATATYNDLTQNTNIDLNLLVNSEEIYNRALDEYGVIDILGFYGKSSKNRIESSKGRWSYDHYNFKYIQNSSGLVTKITVIDSDNDELTYTIEYK